MTQVKCLDRRRASTKLSKGSDLLLLSSSLTPFDQGALPGRSASRGLGSLGHWLSLCFESLILDLHSAHSLLPTDPCSDVTPPRRLPRLSQALLGQAPRQQKRCSPFPQRRKYCPAPSGRPHAFVHERMSESTNDPDTLTTQISPPGQGHSQRAV